MDNDGYGPHRKVHTSYPVVVQREKAEREVATGHYHRRRGTCHFFVFAIT